MRVKPQTSQGKRNLMSLMTLFFISAWPFVNIIYQNKHVFFSMTTVVFYIGLVFACVTALCGILSLVFRIPFYASAIVASIGLVFVFSFSQLAEFLVQEHIFPLRILGFNIRYSYVWLLAIVACSWLVWKNYRSYNLQLIIFMVAISLVLIPLAQTGYFLVYQGSLDSSPIQLAKGDQKEESKIFTRKNNVYFFLMDAYGGNDTLQRVLNFNNKSFLSQLKQKGFFVANRSFSNYHFTLASLSSMLNMSYHTIPDGEGVIDQRTTFNLPLQGFSKVVQLFKHNGYQYVFAPSGRWSEVDCSGSEDLCISPYANTEFLIQVLGLTPFNQLKNKIKLAYLEFEDVKAAVSAFPNRPKFVFAHFAQVHDTLYNADCSRGKMGDPLICSAETKENYRNAVKCSNQELMSLIQYIQDKDPLAIIIVQADHGPSVVSMEEDPEACHYWLKNFNDWKIKSSSDFKNMFSILTAIYLPSHEKVDYLYDSISPVNVFRSITAYLQDTKPRYLEDKSFLLFEKERGKYLGYSVDEFRPSTKWE